MTPEHLEAHVTDIIRRECKKHGHRVSFSYGVLDGRPITYVSYTLNWRHSLRCDLCEALSIWVIVAAVIYLIVGPALWAYDPNCPLFSAVALLNLHRLLRQHHLTTFDEWEAHMADAFADHQLVAKTVERAPNS